MELPKRKGTRLKEYDYGSAGAYFVTVCTQDRRCVLSEIVGEGLAPPVVKLTAYGKVADEQIKSLSARYPSVQIERYVIMPNHIHILLSIQPEAGGASPSPTLMDVVRVLKSQITRLCGCGEGLFQRSFHDHVVRSEQDYREIWEYIDGNPSRWSEDRFYKEETFQQERKSLL